MSLADLKVWTYCIGEAFRMIDIIADKERDILGEELPPYDLENDHGN